MANNKQVNNFEISGKVLVVGQPEEYTTNSGNRKSYRKLVLEVFLGKYSNPVEFEFDLSSMGQLANIKEGEWVTINYALSGNSSTRDGRTRYWNKIIGLSVIKG